VSVEGSEYVVAKIGPVPGSRRPTPLRLPRTGLVGPPSPQAGRWSWRARTG